MLKYYIDNQQLFGGKMFQYTFEKLKHLIGLEERCGFLTDDGQIWPYPSVSPSETNYSLGKNAWADANRRAKDSGIKIVGTIHTHIQNVPGPSQKDLEIARKIGRQIRCVWHIRSGMVTFYAQAGIFDQYKVVYPVWFKVIAWMLFD
jgi:proteasome lid subunit RPN8/RPN11